MLPKLFNVHPFCEKVSKEKKEKKNTGWINQMDRRHLLPKIFNIYFFMGPIRKVFNKKTPFYGQADLNKEGEGVPP